TLLRYIVNQGSITIIGVSLTVGEVNDEKSMVTVWLIPETLQRTNLGALKVNAPVNIEVDVLAKYVERIVKFGDKK
ncbi:MAG: riboflavin synthase, partial [Candidatus Nanopelagicaceae bacterium]